MEGYYETSELTKIARRRAAKLGHRGQRIIRLFKVLLAEFRWFLIIMFTTSVVCTLLLYFFYPDELTPNHARSIPGMAYSVMLMTFFEAPLTYVDDWRVAPVFFGLPILGLLVIAEGVVRLGSLLIHHKRYSREWQKMVAATYENHIVVCGLGNVGFRVVEHLRNFGEEVVCIERESHSQFLQEVEQWQVPIIDGDARITKSLELANVSKAKALIAVTDNDLTNLECALNARELKPGIRAVIRMFDQRLAKKIEKTFDISCAFSTSALSAPVFAQAALSGNILSSFDFDGTTLNAFQMVVNAKCGYAGMTIDELRHKFEVTVLMHSRSNHVDWNPPPATVLEIGDKLLIMTESKNVKNLVATELH